MPDFHALVRERFSGSRALTDQAVEELAQHIEETWRAARSAGKSDEDALALARAQLERPARLPANMTAPSSAGIGGFVSTAWRDIRYALRMLIARPGFTAVAVLTLGLGIGANTAVFSVVRSLLFEPLPFHDPDRLVMLWEVTATDPTDMYIVAAPNYEDWRRSLKSFDETGIWENLNFNFSGDMEAERVPGIRVSASTFRMLGVPPLVGRTFTDAEDAPGHDVAIISFGYWQRRYGGRPDIVGTVARINGRPFEIVGVMPAEFRFPSRQTVVYTPIAYNQNDHDRDSHSFQSAARLRPGVPIASAKAELDALGLALSKQYPDTNRNESATLTPMSDLGVVQLRPTLIALSGAVALVLAIACLNVANLLLAQSASRRQEFAVRAALGASRWRIAGQVLCEGLVIAVIGGAVGIVIAVACTKLLTGVLPASIVSAPFRTAGTGIHIDLWVLAFTTLVALMTGGLFSLAPMAALKRPDLKAGGSRSATGRVRTALVAIEVALALVVLVAAGLMIKSLSKLVTVDPGLDPENVLMATIALPQPDFYGPPVRPRFCIDAIDRVSALPGVLTVGAISHVPLSGANAGRAFTVEGLTLPPGQVASANYRLTCPGYFKAMGIPILKGRDFDLRDTTSTPGVVIINEETAQKYWPGADPIGRRITAGSDDNPGNRLTVVGVVANVRHFGLDNSARREMFRPYSQVAWPVMTIVVKTAMAPGAVASPLRAALQKIDADLPVGPAFTMTQVERESMGSRRFPMILLGAFGAIALALAIVGVYGVVSCVVAQRTREIGIRVALGARRAQVLRLVLLGAMRPVALGIVIGAVGAVFATRLLTTLLYQVSPGDPLVLTAIAGLLAGAGIVASMVPGARATRVDPIHVLRVE
jgi:putative ABC transport system permease protein